MDFPPQANKWLIVRTGRRQGDPWVGVHFGHYRFCFDGNVRYLHTVKRLEVVGKDERLVERGVILFSVEWRQVYVVQRRVGWGPEDYFIHAARLFGEKGITEP